MATETRVLGKLVPSSSQDTYATHDELYGRGGYRAVNTIAERDAIPEERLKVGMEVRVMDGNDTAYYLKSLNPAVWEEVKSFSREDLGLSESETIITNTNFSSQFNEQLSSADYATNFKTLFEKLYKDEIHLGKYINDTTFQDLSGVELTLVKNNLYVDILTQIIYACSGSSLSEIGSVATWNNIKGGRRVNFAEGPIDEYKADDKTVYFADNGSIIFNNVNYTFVDTDYEITSSTASSTKPVQTTAVYQALNTLKQELQPGLISGIQQSYEPNSKALRTVVSLANGQSMTSIVGLSDSEELDNKPVVNLSTNTGNSETLYVTSQDTPTNLTYDFHVYENALSTREVNASDITTSYTLRYNSKNSSAVELEVPDHIVSLGTNYINLNALADQLGNLNEGVEYTFRLSVKTVYTNPDNPEETYEYTNNINWYYTIIDLKLTVDTGLDISYKYPSGTSELGVTCTVSGSKSLLSTAKIMAVVDGAAAEAQIFEGVDPSSGSVEFTIKKLTNGEHTILVAAFYETGAGSNVYSNSYYYKLYVGEPNVPVINVVIPIEGGDVSPIFTGVPTINATTFCQYQLTYYVIYPENSSSRPNVEFRSSAGASTILCGEYAVSEGEISKFSYKYLDPGLRTCYITCGSSRLQYYVKVDSGAIKITNPSNSLQVYLDGSGKSNTSRYRDSWTYNSITSDFSGFTWGTNDGWITNDKGETFLRLVNGAAVDINYQPLSAANLIGSNKYSMVFSAKFKVSSVADENEPIIRFVDQNGKGLQITPTVVSFASTGALAESADAAPSGIKAVINTDEEHTVTVVLYPFTETSTAIRQHVGIVYIYIDGIISGMAKVNTSENTFVLDNPANIKLSAMNCQLDVYSIRCYNLYQNYTNVLNMYLIDSGNYDLMTSRYEFNNVLNSGTPIPGANGIPYLIVNGSHTVKKGDANVTGPAVAMLSDKDTHKWGVESIQFVDPVNPKFNFYCVTQLPIGAKEVDYDQKTNSPGLQIQGTSSAVYPVKNLKIKLKAGLTYLGLPEEAMRHENVSYNSSDLTKSKLNFQGVTYDNKKKWQISDNSTQETTFTIKVDYAESSGSHNAGTANYVNNLLTASGEYIPPQKLQAEGKLVGKKNTSNYASDIRTTCEGKAIMLYYREKESDLLIYGGKANILNDKSDEAVFGFTKIPNYTYDFANGDPDFLETDDYTPLRVITMPELAGTVNTIYKETLMPRVDGAVQEGQTPFASWNDFVETVSALSESELRDVMNAIKSEITLKLSGKPLAFASDVDNHLLIVNETPATVSPLVANDSFALGNFSEISGLALKDANTLYAVSDNSGLYKVDLASKSATLVNNIGNKDCEAVSVNSKGNIVVAVEGSVDGANPVSDENNQCIYTLANESAVPQPIFNEDFASFKEAGTDTNGFEAICHYNDDIVFIGNQAKPKNVVVYDLANSSILASVELKKQAGMYEEIADFDYNPETKELLILDSELGIITVWKVNASDWTFTYDSSKAYKCPVETLKVTDNNANPEGLAYDSVNKVFYVSDENGNKIYSCTPGAAQVSYTLKDGKANPTQCWEFRTNDNDKGYFLKVDFRETISKVTDGQTVYYPQWFGNVWESRFPDDKTADNTEYNGGRVPYLLYTIANWIYSTNRYAAGISAAEKEARRQKFLTELPLYFNVDMLCDYYMITDVIAAADQRVKNMMWAFYRNPEIDPENDIMKGMRAYPIFYDNDTILGVNNSGVLFDTLSGTLTLPWDTTHETTCLSTGYSGALPSTRNTQFAMSGHDSVIWVNLRELMTDQLKEAFLRLRGGEAGTRFDYNSLVDMYDDQFTGKYAETIYNIDAVYKYVDPQIVDHYPKAQGSRKAHRHWFLSNRISMFNAKYNLYDGAYMELKGGSRASGSKCEISLTMDHDWWASIKQGDANGAAARNQFEFNKDEEKALNYQTIFNSSPTVGTTVSIYGLEHARKLHINWDGSTQTNFMGFGGLSRLVEYEQTSAVVPGSAVPSLEICPNLQSAIFTQVNIPEGINGYIKPLIKLKTLKFINCIGQCNAIELPQGGLIENLHLPNISNTQLKFVNLPKLSNAGITFDNTILVGGQEFTEIDEKGEEITVQGYGVQATDVNPWSNVTSLIVSNCPNINCEELLSKVSESVSRIYLEGLEMSGDGSELINLRRRGVKGYAANLSTGVDVCTISGTYKLTKLLDDRTYAELVEYFPNLTIKNLEYSLYKFTMGANTTSAVKVTNMETGLNGSNDGYAPTGHAAEILAKRHGYLVKLDASGKFKATQLSDVNHNNLLNGDPADLSGESGDYMIYEPEYWYKGLNDFKNNSVYAAFAARKPESIDDPAKRAPLTSLSYIDFGSAVSNASEFNSENVYLSGYEVNAASTGNQLLIQQSSSQALVFYYVLPENNKFKYFKVIGPVSSTKVGAVVISEDKTVLLVLSASGSSGMYSGSYLVGNLSECSETPYAIVFTVPEAYKNAESLLTLTTSNDMMDLEEWVRHPETFVGRSYSVPDSLGTIKSCVYDGDGSYPESGLPENQLTVASLHTSLVSRDNKAGATKQFTSFDYEQFKDIMNLAFIKYGTTDLVSCVGIGLTDKDTQANFPVHVRSLAHLGMQDTVNLEDSLGTSLDINGNVTNNPVLLGYEKLSGLGSSCSAEDVVDRTGAIRSTRTGRVIPILPNNNDEKSIIYPLSGRYLDLFNSGNNSVVISGGALGYCGTVKFTGNSGGTYTYGRLAIGRGNATAGNSPTIPSRMIYFDATAANSSSQPKLNGFSGKTGIMNAVRLMIIPNQVEFVNSNEF